MKIFLDFLLCYFVSISSVCGYTYYRDVRGQRHYRRHVNDARGQTSNLRGETGSIPTPGAGDCPLQCRCIALSHLGYRDMAERWMSLGRLNGQDNTFKGTEAPVWKEDPAELKGRDVVCMGLNKIPRPLPESKLFVTVVELNILNLQP